ncbi:BspA family leucine-rich repeat surface protein [Mesonia ostreae]|uniref:BspA family leucine-rich repeat surface protein n=1 Tax=Mesonia ostreae TaxID=861110 RepID=A0ABU2KKM2_9FLAO|nr:BspA family leucine-rich repeat surface protein [Mesonia ostreae]MDT0295234.1 BspA family leucine-rich repeat surface protein [Mesonia ostreae]
MKNLYLFLFIVFSTFYTQAQNQPFITTWEVDENESITIPTEGNGYNYTIDFGDGTIESNITGDISHTYTELGIYTVSISGDFPRIYFNGSEEANKIKSIEQWGHIEWQSMNSAFFGCENLTINANDAPDLTQVTDLSHMFKLAKAFNQSINHWDVSNVNDMNNMFRGAYNFNKPLNNWDVSNVTNMGSMFTGANDFNQPLNSWDVSNVTVMGFMFWGAYNFNNPLSNWNVSNVTNMNSMFRDAESFNQPLSSWDVSNVTDMGNMFSCKYSNTDSTFNQPLDSWDVSNVTKMNHMFFFAETFNQPLNNWDVSNVTEMAEMFSVAASFNQPLDNWDVSNVIRMMSMFESADTFNQPLNNWDVSSVNNMTDMFRFNDAFNQPLSNWDVSNVTYMTGMFGYTELFNQPLDNWDVSNVYNMEGIFSHAVSFNQDLSNWNFNQSVSLTTFLGEAFVSYSGLDVENYDALLSHLAFLNLSEDELGAHDLKFCNQNARNALLINGWTIYGDSESENCNSISGIILYDENNNGCDSNDAGISDFMVNTNNGEDDIFTYSSNGYYELGTIGTNFTVSLVNYPSYYTVSPPSIDVTFTTSNTEVADFCVTANQTMKDLNVVLFPTSEARPGFEADYQLVVENIGTQTIANATVTLDFDDSMQSFVSANVTPASNTASQLTFNITNLQPLTFQTVDLAMQTFQPPTVNGDDILSFTVNVSPSANDFTPNDNTFVYDQTVVNSYDPNDKQVLQGEEIEIDDADEYLNYLIRFQNTGTASAINVRILDTLHPKLDYTTLRPVSASHNYRIEVTNENEVEFIFDGINLPDEYTNEPASHGFVAYKIKPKSDVAVGDFITGDAQIYFDFNAPIITNMVSTEIIDNLNVSIYDLANNISIYPNPTQNTLHIEVKNNQEVEQIKIYNLSGLELINIKDNKQQLNLESLSAGIYFIQIQTHLGTVNKRFIKK